MRGGLQVKGHSRNTPKTLNGSSTAAKFLRGPLINPYARVLSGTCLKLPWMATHKLP